MIAAIGFVGSYAAVRDLAVRKGFGDFAVAFPIGIDAGIGVLLALDLLLTWVRMPFPLLRHTAWALTAATIGFNAAAAWPDALGVGMHASIPVLFIVVVEAARHAIGRGADITADRHIEPVRLIRWILAPVSTFRLWRRMKLWELRSYDAVIKLEQDRLIYRARLQMRYGRLWRWNAPVEERLPLRLTRYGRALVALDAPATAPAPDPHSPDAPDAFDAAAAEAIALAPSAGAQPNAPALSAGADADAQSHADAPAAPAPVQPDAHPHSDAPDARTRVFRSLGCDVPPPSALVLDLAPMRAAIPEVTADAHPPHSPPQMRMQANARTSDETLIVAAVDLARTGALSLRRVQRELGIGQKRAQRIIPVAEKRIRDALEKAG
ncbi:DUF2637 domain-containing protein [Streptomyces chryseus]|uniref:DUF2637 domain-containing protein n=1 Tax=Streptomyces chryseus TaxID=68186 RepID=UPI003570EADD